MSRKAAQKCMKKMLDQSIAGDKLDKELQQQMGGSPYMVTKKGTPRVEYYGATTIKEMEEILDEEDEADEESEDEDYESEDSEEDSDEEESEDNESEEDSDEDSDEESEE